MLAVFYHSIPDSTENADNKKPSFPYETGESWVFLYYSKHVLGAVGRNRTGDLHITNVLLYQLSYNGEDAYSNKQFGNFASVNPIFLSNSCSRHPNQSAW